MTPQDREQFQALTLRQSKLEEALFQLRTDLTQWERRLESFSFPSEDSIVIPPLPVTAAAPIAPGPPPFPPLPPFTETVVPVIPETVAKSFPAEIPSPLLPEIPNSPGTKSSPEETSGNLEFQFGRWLARIGVVLALITLISFSTLAYKHFHHLMGPWSRLSFLVAISVSLVVAGLRIERISRLTVYGRTLAGGGLACLYYTLYGATYVTPLQVIHSQLLGGFLLLGWSAYVLYLAEKKKSELLSVFAIALAYFSSAITPVGDFTMVANLILSLTAVVFLIRNAWTGLSYLCLVGTYVGVLRQFLVYDNISVGLEWRHGIAFWPAAMYLTGAWIIYTAGIFLSTTPHFAAGKRMAFLCLNNGALIGLIALASHLSGFGHIGAIFCFLGVVFLACSGLARFFRSDVSEVAGAYLIQGLALATGGIALAYTGTTRGLLITIESVFLASAGAFTRNRIFQAAGYVSAVLGTAYLFGEIVFDNHPSWILPLGGAMAMLANAWLARYEFWKQPRDVTATRFVPASAYFILLALGLLASGIISLQTSDAWIAVDLAFATLVLTLSIYLVPLFELPLLSQLLLVLAQVSSFIPPVFSTGSNAQPRWSQTLAALITMILVLWWPRQKTVRLGAWLQPLLLVYALAMVSFGFNAVHPDVTAQGWMIAASLLSLGFLVFGAWARTWQFIVSGQIFLALAICTYFNPPIGPDSFPWTWWAAAFPPAVVFLTGLLIQHWLPLLNLTESLRTEARIIARIYQGLALGLVVRWIYGVVPYDEVTLAFFLMATSLLVWNVRRPSAFGLRAGLVVSVIGAINQLNTEDFPAHLGFTWMDTTSILLFLLQPAILRRWGRELVSTAESWVVILLSSALGWLFISNYIEGSDAHNLTLGWALFALAVTMIGFVANERRQRWCGLVILAAAILRVGLYDFWGFSDLYKVLTFFALTVICLGLSFIYYKFGDRLKGLL